VRCDVARQLARRDAARRQAPARCGAATGPGGWPQRDAGRRLAPGGCAAVVAPQDVARGGGQLAPAGEEAGLAGEPAAAARLG
jgi:hypothetical protein